ncbi:MAG: MBL fold metallo-hydrolase RNA specificity domain-containing protein [Bdellovibrionales bacterium]
MRFYWLFQAPGTRGHSLETGANELKIHGSYHPVNAQVYKIDSLSAHGDQEDLLHWLGKSENRSYEKVFIVHGEVDSAEALQTKITDQFGPCSQVPELGSQFEL